MSRFLYNSGVGQPQIKAVNFLPASGALTPEKGDVDVQVDLLDGSRSTFVAATPDQAGPWMEQGGVDYCYSTPVLYVATVDPESVGAAVAAMAQDMGGYWLRYYNSPGGLKRAK